MRESVGVTINSVLLETGAIPAVRRVMDAGGGAAPARISGMRHD